MAHAWAWGERLGKRSDVGSARACRIKLFMHSRGGYYKWRTVGRRESSEASVKRRASRVAIWPLVQLNMGAEQQGRSMCDEVTSGWI